MDNKAEDNGLRVAPINAVAMGLLNAQLHQEREDARAARTLHNTIMAPQRRSWRQLDTATDALVPTAPPPRNERLAVDAPVSVVFGSMQQGKSTFINYMRFHNMWNDPSVRGRSARIGFGDATTTRCAVYGIQNPESGEVVFLLDTPGLGADPERQEADIINMCLGMRNFTRFSTPILIHGSATAFTHQYEKSLSEYRDMMPDVFDQGLIVVVTSYGHSDDAEEERKEKFTGRGTTEEAELDRLRDRFRRKFRLRHDPILITMNSMPRDQTDREHSTTQREFILNCLQTSYTANVPTARIMHKPPLWRSDDQLEVVGLKAAADGYRQSLQDHEPLATDLLRQQAARNQELQERVNEYNRMEQQLHRYTDPNEMVLDSVFLNTGRKLFAQTRSWDLRVQHNITSRRRITSSGCEVNVDHQDVRRDAGSARSPLFGRICVQVLLFSEPSIVYQSQIAALSTRMNAAREVIHQLSAQLDQVATNAGAVQSAIRRMQQQLDEKITRILEVQRMEVTLDEVMAHYRNHPLIDVSHGEPPEVMIEASDAVVPPRVQMLIAQYQRIAAEAVD